MKQCLGVDTFITGFGHKRFLWLRIVSIRYSSTLFFILFCARLINLLVFINAHSVHVFGAWGSRDKSKAMLSNCIQMALSVSTPVARKGSEFAFKTQGFEIQKSNQNKSVSPSVLSISNVCLHLVTLLSRIKYDI